MHRFHAPDLAFDRDVPLPPDEAHHLARVLRLAVGSTVAVFDGRGNEAIATVQSVAGKRVVVRAVERRTTSPEHAVAITLAQALLKGDAMDDVVRDAVMLGVVAVQPFLSARTEVPRAAVRAGGRVERWERTALASAKQCGRAVLPAVRPPIDFGELIADAAGSMCLMFVEPAAAAGTSLEPLQVLESRVPAKATLVIGPEGGWAPEEIATARQTGIRLVSLGPHTLRADAAGAAALAVIRYVWKDL